MRPIKTLGRMARNSDRTVGLLDSLAATLKESLDNQATASNERLDGLLKGSDSSLSKLTEITESLSNQATANNERLDELVKSGDSTFSKLTQIGESLHNQATASNERLDGLLKGGDSAFAKLTQIGESLSNQATGSNERLDGVLKGLDGLLNGNDRALNGLSRILEALDNQATASNRRMDLLIAATKSQGEASNNRPSSATDYQSTAKPQAQVRVAETVQVSKTASPSSGFARSQNWLNAESPKALPLPQIAAKGLLASSKALNGARKPAPTNDLPHYQRLLDEIKPWSGPVPRGYMVDFFGILTDANFRSEWGVNPASAGGVNMATTISPLKGANGEWWFEAVNWIEAAREARDRFVMITLGACYGAQAVGAYRALQMINPLPCKLVAIEPVPDNYLWVRKHFRDNGIDPDQHWLVQQAISDRNEPVYFPIGAPGSGANNCIATDTLGERRIFAENLIAAGKAPEVLENLLLSNSTGVIKNLLPGQDAAAEIKCVSAVTLRDLVTVFDVVDYIEADIQQSEIRVFPPFIDLLKQKVRRIHIGTHGAETHQMLHDLFAGNGWEIVFSYAPDAWHESGLGAFETNDGVLTVRNPDL